MELSFLKYWQNLKDESYYNQITPTEADLIWVPEVTFFNTEKKSTSLKDVKVDKSCPRLL